MPELSTIYDYMRSYSGLLGKRILHHVTAMKFWYDTLWLSEPVPIDELILGEFSFKIPLQLQWAADHRLISVQILSTFDC